MEDSIKVCERRVGVCGSERDSERALTTSSNITTSTPLPPPPPTHQSYRIFNTWLGDPMRLVVLETVLEQIEQLDLLPNATVTGDRLLAGLKSIEVH